MEIFEGDYKNFNKRLLSINSFVALATFAFYSYIILSLDLAKYYTVIIELILCIILISIVFYRNKSFFIQTISFDKNTILLQGEIFNNEYRKELDIKETNIELRCLSSKQGLESVLFYIRLKNKKDKYTINLFDTFSDEQIIEIFNEFKKHKEEKIIMDEKIDILRIQEKIEKCQ
ncbi:hypothetical protein LNQ49_21460 [Flavobacterium sp. F-65]|uniref:PH domain-containing protein n=1 Tax=Flavobacterium pisciphilum TaxID=2893755 RepID=A0ABS8MZE6_9FLAO|nr:hypothetical protein [Flavobacterium sp. F-65]MCC9074161.1 hypothetical protein [Flavobacterium sp. F-65]